MASGQSNVIAGNGMSGVIIVGTSTNSFVRNNIIGLGANGNTPIPNQLYGVEIQQGSHTVEENIISGNELSGVSVANASSEGTIVRANRIGVDTTGLLARPNGEWGVRIVSNANGITIGGPDQEDRNIISGNASAGIFTSIITSNITIETNIIGGNLTGSAAIPNGGDGIDLQGRESLVYGNSLQGNNGSGIRLFGTGARDNVIAGNSIGVDVETLVDAVPNQLHGVFLENAGPRNQIGGARQGFLGFNNIISGNTLSGIRISAGTAGDQEILGNSIGLNALSTGTIPNGQHGIHNLSSGVDIHDNTISGNTGQGIRLEGSGASNNTIHNNYIGTGILGNLEYGNDSHGIALIGAGSGNIIGGPVNDDRNVIAASGESGVFIDGATAAGQTLQGNLIGLNPDGDAAYSNAANGVAISASGVNVLTNIISGNASNGLLILGADNVSGVVVRGNRIGVNAAGTAAIPNSQRGIAVDGEVTGATIGGPDAAHRNVISGNQSAGMLITNTVSGVTVQGNHIGTNLAGNAAIGNSTHGLDIQGGGNNILDNVISGNSQAGINLQGSDVTNVFIRGNTIGLNAAGTAALPNATRGIFLGNSSTGVVIGGPDAAHRNVVSGNQSNGISINSTSSENIIQGNYIGLHPAGTSSIGNGGSGIEMRGGSNDLVDNVISGNSGHGVTLDWFSSADNILEGNRIGTNAAGTTALPNTLSGINLNTNATGNIIRENVVSGNQTVGISLGGVAVVHDNLVGLTADGTGAVANNTDGIVVLSGGADSVIYDNVISGNNRYGVFIQGSLQNFTGNIVGLNQAGNAAVPNGNDGIRIQADNVTIGASAPASRNIISGNGDDGVQVEGENAVILRNYVGLDADGSTAIRNNNRGVIIGGGGSGSEVLFNYIAGHETAPGLFLGNTSLAQGNFIGMNADFDTVLPNSIGILVGVSAPGVEIVNNIVGGSINAGMRIQSQSTVEANAVGLNPSGNAILPNGLGIEVIQNAAGTTFHNNFVSGNSGAGFVLERQSTLTGNFIGLAFDGSTIFGNGGHGIDIRPAATNTIVGGAATGDVNYIVGSGGNGIHIGADDASVVENLIGRSIHDSTTGGNDGAGIMIAGGLGSMGDITGNTILNNNGHGIAHGAAAVNVDLSDNIIFNNALQAVALGPNFGLMSNDDLDLDTGANGFQNWPSLGPIATGATEVTGTLNSSASSTFTVHLYRSTDTALGGTGQMEEAVGSTTVGTDGDGFGSFTIALGSPAVDGDHFAAVAVSESTGASSQVGRAVLVEETPWPTILDVVRADGADEETSEDTLGFDIVFSKPVVMEDSSPINILEGGDLTGSIVDSVASPFGFAGDFATSATLVDTGYTASLTGTSFSWEFWHKREALNQGVYLTIGDFSISDGSDYSLVVDYGAGEIHATEQAYRLFGSWNHWAGTFDAVSGESRIYLNGALQSTHDLATTTSVSGSVLLGASSGAAIGSMDEFRLWDGARATGDLSSGVYTVADGSEAGLLLHFSFNDGGPDKSIDQIASTVYTSSWSTTVLAGTGSGSLGIELQPSPSLYDVNFFTLEGPSSGDNNSEEYEFTEPSNVPDWMILHP
ncbi:MAG: right-handed parallel beta-helix repeat-containing protein [Candidatus Sumerlaeia bacterium]|nr:right-handed parallel beta-helix repeat-containing protein [Candidatus Sumerlaeia bacterium]